MNMPRELTTRDYDADPGLASFPSTFAEDGQISQMSIAEPFKSVTHTRRSHPVRPHDKSFDVVEPDKPSDHSDHHDRAHPDAIAGDMVKIVDEGHETWADRDLVETGLRAKFGPNWEDYVINDKKNNTITIAQWTIDSGKAIEAGRAKYRASPSF